MGTFRDIDYRLRPAKNIERKMMMDILQRLPNIHNLEDYRYIGFGSTYFSDVRLVHRRLGIEDIISIEKEDRNKERFIYNKPFDCVDMVFEKSSDALPELDWNKPTILWLDYDNELQSYMISDIREFMTSAVPGSVIFITVNAHPRNVDEREDGDRTMVDEIKDNLSSKLVPTDVSKKDVRGWGYGDVCRRIILNQITEKFLPNRNAGVPEDEQIEFKQLANYKYQDSSKMRTIGGILYSDEIKNGYENANFEELKAVRSGDEALKITTPKLTYKEMRGLDAEMPDPPSESKVPVPQPDVSKYGKFYRYFPRFRESEL